MSVQPLSWKLHTQMNLIIMSKMAHVLVNSRATTEISGGLVSQMGTILY